jgi:hypothetical protein
MSYISILLAENLAAGFDRGEINPHADVHAAKDAITFRTVSRTIH